MSDWTTPEDVPEVVRERLHDWLNAGHPAQATTLANFAVAEVIRAFWPAPARTLADDLAHIAEHWETWATDTITEELTAATTRAEQTERYRDEALAEVERERDLGVALAHERDEVSEALAVERRRVEEIAAERDEARAEVERLTAEVERFDGEVPQETPWQFIDDIRALLGKEPLNPADVKPGEPWLIRVGEREAVANRDGTSDWWTWSVSFFEGGSDNVADKNITLVSRLVPEPRVITDPDELDRLAEGAVILSFSTKYALQRVNAGDGWYCPATKGRATSTDVLSCGPVTVLWEPVA